MSDKPVTREQIWDFFKTLDRSRFIEDDNLKKLAQYDRPLPIGHGQTISQPSLVLAMTQELNLHEKCRVLEIGTGSGYQTALLAQFCQHVYTVERIKELADKSRARLESMGYTNISFKVGDGSEGWAEFAPYDRIIVTAAAGKLPTKLIQQLKAGGRMIVPVGPSQSQELMLITKDESGLITKESLGDVRFVELRGEYGWH
ncbi:MAG: protein-L-isoaspartate(D-aspartate) O-methyltransferase [Syntrophomonadaceae bacterium]|nr:protein-L-isoaspartate(D-aspartate) O-methyltransferase [Syntrophomonadaceae bacterium]